MKTRPRVSRRVLPLLAAPLLGLFSTSATGQPQEPRRPEAYGTATFSIYQIPAAGCQPILPGAVMSWEFPGFRFATTGSPLPVLLDCPINLPSGSKIQGFEVLAHDAEDAGDNFQASFAYCASASFSDGCTYVGSVSTPGTFASPYTGYLYSDLSGLGLVVDKLNVTYFVRLTLNHLFDATAFRQVNVYYRLQVSTPAPGTQTFGDVPPTHLYYKAIEALAASGITGGCGSGNFCPSGTLTRGEVAAFFARALGLHFPD